MTNKPKYEEVQGQTDEQGQVTMVVYIIAPLEYYIAGICTRSLKKNK